MVGKSSRCSLLGLRGALLLVAASLLGPSCTRSADSGASDSQPSGTKTSYVVNGVPFSMVAVEGGTFTIGATPEQVNPERDEMPAHRVTLASFTIGETEVTQALWMAVMESNPSGFRGDSLPVEHVSWEDCQTFILQLNELTGEQFRLPTEAEWEYAARGGRLGKGCQYSGSDTLDNVAWYIDNSDGTTHPVATKQANELGLYDMSGNVLEWCQDWFANYGSAAQTNPAGPASGSRRVYRGGGWYSNAADSRVAHRDYFAPTGHSMVLGFRLAR